MKRKSVRGIGKIVTEKDIAMDFAHVSSISLTG